MIRDYCFYDGKPENLTYLYNKSLIEMQMESSNTGKALGTMQKSGGIALEDAREIDGVSGVGLYLGYKAMEFVGGEIV